MKLTRIFLFVALVAVTFVPTKGAKNEDEKSATTSNFENDEQKVASSNSTSLERNETDVINETRAIQLNPDYESDNEEEEEYDSDAEEEEEDDSDVKTMLNKALAESRKVRRKALDLVKKHRVKITVALVLIAFRKEICQLLVNKIAPASGVDPETGKVIRKWVRLSPTSILKIIVFVDIMRQLQKGGKKWNAVTIAILLFGARNPFLSSLITKAILQENNSYVPPVEQHYAFERINERYQRDCLALQKAAYYKSRPDSPISHLAHPQDDAEGKKKNYSSTVIILEIKNVDSNRVETLRDEASFLIHQHRQQAIPYASAEDLRTALGGKPTPVEILILLESPGGAVSEFALGSQQLLRLRKEPGIRVTVCVDKVAASGGYQIACASSPGRLFAAPFALLGSIGVYGQTINIQKLLEGWGVRPMVFRAGSEKNPIGLLGDISSRDVKSTQSMVEEVHTAFKRYVAQARPVLAHTIDELATGKVWLGHDALKVGLVDRLITSDEYIGERIQAGAKVLKLVTSPRKRTLFGGHHARAGIGNRVQSWILGSVMEHSKKAFLGLAKQIDFQETEPFSAKVTASASIPSTKSGS